MNAYYKSDLRDTLKCCRMVLKLLGLWPLIYGHASNLEKIISMILICICLISLSFVLLPAGYYSIFYVKDLNLKIKTIGPVCYCPSCVIKYGYLSLKSSAFKRCIRQIENDWKVIERAEHRDIMIGNVAIAQKLSISFGIYLYASAILYHIILPAWTNTLQTDENTTAKPLIYPGYKLFLDAYTTPTYEFIYFMHYVYSIFSSGVTVASCSLVALFVCHACGLVQVQMERLKCLVAESKRQKDRGESFLAVIVNGHVDALRYSKAVSKALQEICFLEVVGSTFMICCLEYLCIVEWANRDMIAIAIYAGFIISLTFNITILCYAGELLVEEGGKIGEATYNIGWYDLSQRKSVDLILLIAVSKLPPKLTGGKIFEISVNTLSTVLKSSVVYLNLCRAVTEW